MNQTTKQLATAIISAARRHSADLCPDLRDAIYTMAPLPIENLPLPMGTDGTHLLYNPDLLILSFKENRDYPAQLLLHICFHCVLGHLSQRKEAQSRELFDAVADCKVDGLAKALIPEFWPKHPADKRIRLAEPLQYLIRKENLSGKDLERFHRAHVHAQMDDHSLWMLRPLDDGVDEDPDWAEAGQALARSLEMNHRCSFCDDDIAEALRQDLAPAPENNRDYTEILNNFLKQTVSEAVNLDAIDPMWYHYGLDAFGDIPLIEPSEDGDAIRQGTLVLAIDTSGSCDGDVCRRFLRELSNLIEGLSALNSLSEIVVIQCDHLIREELHLASPHAWRSMAESFQPQGFCSTDFRPVFERAKALKDVVGLIYLTDGYGDFPDAPPTFPHLFLLEDSVAEAFMPSWANITALSP